MRNLLFTMSYDGTNYHGFQIQKSDITIQQVLNEAFLKITKEKVDIIGCGRTDAGVHALDYNFSVKTNSKIPCEKFPVALNTALPDDIVIKKCEEKSEDFHARYDIVNKTYRYIVYKGKIRNPFYDRYTFHYTFPVNMDNMKKCAKQIEGTHDFSSFMAQGSSIRDTVRTVYSIEITEKDDFIYFDVCGNGFLYNMVRIIVGTLLSAGRGIYSEEDVKKIIEDKKRENSGTTVPPQGLFLKEVQYGK